MNVTERPHTTYIHTCIILYINIAGRCYFYLDYRHSMVRAYHTMLILQDVADKSSLDFLRQTDIRRYTSH